MIRPIIPPTRKCSPPSVPDMTTRLTHPTVARNGISASLPPENGARRRAGYALLAASLGFGVVQLDVSVVNVAVQSIGDELGGSISGLQWVVGAYTVAFAAL